ncbi:lysis system i-spanin subunit Rz [Pseudomonas sp.]|uniref:lysis system i-spanin subunit Rz n=1 Tax=Pseudomonas sp. TaxID=306 RepID=UPI00257D130B|nr:lysis system i-spanin subunit Rz [Pseudomonas sp.]
MTKYLSIALVACIAVIAFGWQRLESQGKDLTTAQAAVTTLEAQAESRRNTQKLLTQLDTEHTEELANAQATNNQLRADIASGVVGLSVKAACPAVRTTASATRVDDAEARAQLDPASAGRIVATANEGDAAIIALTALQDYVNTICLRK